VRATELEQHLRGHEEERPDGRHALAVTLLGVGIVLAAAIVALIGLAIYDAEALPLLVYVRNHVGNGHNIVDAVIGDRSVRIRGSYEFGYAFSLCVYASLLAALATISRALIQGGTRLMRRAR